MCGIAGIVSPNAADRDRIGRMLDVMVHRGPDDAGTYSSEQATLGQRRLSIIDLEGGHQPIANSDESIWIVCNGEIYNYEELRADLAASGASFRTEGDTEVILHLYERHGPDCVNYLRGMFAFAIWDERKKRLFCARDRFGQKPFYYALRGGNFVFGSEIKSLLEYDPTLRSPDLAALDQYLSLRIVTSPRSMFKEIKKLPPAQMLFFSADDGLEIRRYWELKYEPKSEGSEQQQIDQLEEQLLESLKLHMVSDVPVGAFLSGGLDSSLLVGMLMKHVVSEPIQTFTMGLPYENYDEAPYARMIGERFGTNHREQTVTPSLTKHLPDLLWHLDEPSDPLSVCTYLLAKFAAKNVKVVLGGDGGDELFGGYDRYYGMVYADFYSKVPRTLRSYLIGPLLNAMSDGRWYKSKTHQIKWLHDLSFHSGGARYFRSLSYFYFGPDWYDSLYGPALDAHAEGFDPGLEIRRSYEGARANQIVDKMLSSDSFNRMPDHPVMISDRMTMSASLEARSPFLDHVLAEFTAKLPVNLKVRGRKLRYIQYQLAARYLPPEVLNRPKQGFSSALPYMLADEYSALYEAFLRDSWLSRDELLQQPAIEGILSEHQSGRRDHGNRLWLLVNCEAWYRMHIKGESREDLSELIRESRRPDTRVAA